MERLSVQEASKRFGISRARLYKLLDRGVIIGQRSKMRGRSASSWIDSESLRAHIETRDERHGRPKAERDGDYLPVRVAAEQSGCSMRNISYLIKNGRVESKKAGGNALVCYPSLLKYLEDRMQL